jgi:hypothetical protein
VSRESRGASAGGGCVALIALVIAVSLVVMAIISLAAVVDPFNWMPTAHEIWEDCDGDCALAHRFPGFWWHMVANLLYAGLAVAAAVWFGARVVALRETRTARYDGVAADGAFRDARRDCVQAGTVLGGLALIALLAAAL